MPFAVFRRHQRKLLAFLAIFAMVAFSLDFSLLRGRFGSGGRDPVVATLYGKAVHQSDLAEMAAQRSRANRFLGRLTGQPNYFGGLETRPLVDALILQHEADELGLPVNKNIAVNWLRQVTDNVLNTELFNRMYQESFSDEVTDEQLLRDIANQLRLAEVRGLPGVPQVTPLDVFQAYRDQYETVSARFVKFPVTDFLNEVSNPTESQIRSYYEKYKDVLPDPSSETPGFKIPRRVQVEYIKANVNDLVQKIRSELTEAELREAFQNRPEDFPTTPTELPVDLFAGDEAEDLTPRLDDPFEEVRSYVATTLAGERAQQRVENLLDEVQDEVMVPYYEEYYEVQDENSEAAETGKKAKPLPKLGDRLKKAAETAGIAYGTTPLIDRTEAESGSFDVIGRSRLGEDPFAESQNFAEVFFDPRAPLFDPYYKLSDPQGNRYRAWKIRDVPARVPDLKEVHDEVVHAWKLEKARAKAEQAARAFAEKVRKANQNIEQVAAETQRDVTITAPVTRLQSTISANPFAPSTPRERDPRDPRRRTGAA